MDFVIFQYLNNFALKYLWLDVIAIFFAKYLGWVLIGILILFLIKNFKKYWKMVVTAFVSAVLARFIITEIIRWLWPRTRPFVGAEVNLLLPHRLTGSFPSGHAAFFFALSMAFFLCYKKVYPLPKFWWGAGILFFIASFLIAISRVFSGLHWPSDILGGALVGIFSAWLIHKIFRK
ncbi:phosphatase PAP2 family protein [Patescibacteria group bacterium]|nr:phosphatase PAP2 family protein [Patescibacteria group bacterium]